MGYLSCWLIRMSLSSEECCVDLIRTQSSLKAHLRWLTVLKTCTLDNRAIKLHYLPSAGASNDHVAFCIDANLNHTWLVPSVSLGLSQYFAMRVYSLSFHFVSRSCWSLSFLWWWFQAVLHSGAAMRPSSSIWIFNFNFKFYTSDLFFILNSIFKQYLLLIKWEFYLIKLIE